MIKLTYSFEWCLVGMPKYIQKHHGTSMVKCPGTSKKKTRLYVYLFIWRTMLLFQSFSSQWTM